MRFEDSGPLSAPAAGTDTPAPERSGLRAAWRAALFAFLLSRLLILVSAALAVAIAQQWGGPAGQQDDVRLFTPASVSALGNRVLANDAAWYLEVAREGYERRPFDASRQANWAFFPLHPWLWRGAMATGLAPAVAGLLLANLLFLLGLVQAHRWVRLLKDGATADRAVLLLALFPTAYFFALPWTESLFLLLSASSLLALEQRRAGRASVFNLLAGATRPTGVLLSALLWWNGRRGRRLPPPATWLFAGIGLLGLLAFMALLWRATGNPLAFSDIQVAWGRDGGSLTKHLVRWFTDPLVITEPWNLRWINNAALLLGLAAAAWLWRRHKRPDLAMYTLLCLLIPWSTGTLVSMGRYVLTCLPVFLALAAWLQGPRAWTAWLCASSACLAGMAALFALGASFAGA